MKLKYFSHSSFQVTTDNGQVLLIDPFLDDNPTSPVSSDDVSANYIILTHGHGDHIGDSFKIAKRCDPLFFCVNELANYCTEKGFRAHNMHIDGAHLFDFDRLKFTIAHHGAMTPDNTYAGEPAGILLTIDQKTIYHTGDTGLFYDMKLTQASLQTRWHEPRSLSENRAFGVYAYLVKVETFPKNKHSHMFDIGVYAYLRALFLGNNDEFGQIA